MSIDFHSRHKVTIEQLYEAAAKADIKIMQGEEDPDKFTMVWDVEDYETYAKSLSPEIETSFRECLEPIDGRFVISRYFYLCDGIVHYSQFGVTRKCSDDMGIAHQLFEHIPNNELVTKEDEYEEDKQLAFLLFHRNGLRKGLLDEWWEEYRTTDPLTFLPEDHPAVVRIKREDFNEEWFFDSKRFPDKETRAKAFKDFLTKSMSKNEEEMESIGE